MLTIDKVKCEEIRNVAEAHVKRLRKANNSNDILLIDELESLLIEFSDLYEGSVSEDEIQVLVAHLNHIIKLFTIKKLCLDDFLGHTIEEKYEIIDLIRLDSAVLKLATLANDYFNNDALGPDCDQLCKFEKIAEFQITEPTFEEEFWIELQRVPIEKLVIVVDRDVSQILDYLRDTRNVEKVRLSGASVDVYMGDVKMDQIFDYIKSNQSIKVDIFALYPLSSLSSLWRSIFRSGSREI